MTASMDQGTERSQVRTAGRSARRAVSAAERAVMEPALITHLQSVDAVRDAVSIGVFIAHDGEPDLRPLVEWLWSRDVVVSLPVLQDDPNDYSMDFVPWRRADVLRKGRYGIPVPPEAPAIEPETLLVSFTGFDAAGSRIGRGAGFFDRYLVTSQAQICGVGFEVQRFDHVPTTDHDVALPVIVTDLGVRFVRTTGR